MHEEAGQETFDRKPSDLLNFRGRTANHFWLPPLRHRQAVGESCL